MSGDEVVSSREAWLARAKVAEEAAELLEEAASASSSVGSRNTFGECAEGRSMHTTIQSAILGFTDDLTHQATQARALAGSYRQAANDYQSADDMSAANIKSP